MRSVLKAVTAVILVLFLFQKVPVCMYPEEQPQLRGATVKDIELRINEVTDSPLWLFHIGSSMHPTIKDKQTCLCEKQEEYEVGDIISFYWFIDEIELQFITHRIKEITPAGFVTQGDNNDGVDYSVTPEDQVFCKIKEKYKLFDLVNA